MAMTNWADVDPRAVRRSVYYEGGSTVYEGMPVCFNYDTTTNWSGFDKSQAEGYATRDTDTPEGSQNEGKWIRVENPADNNLMSFAGVVAKGSNLIGTTGPGLVDIYIPNGAIVPVRCDVDTTVGVTILAITVGSQELGQPVSGTSRPVAIAAETETALDSTAGITLATLDPNRFIYQNLDGTALSVGAGTSALAVNEINITSAQTSGRFTALSVSAAATAGGGAHAWMYGLGLDVQASVSGTTTTHVSGSNFALNLTGGTPTEYDTVCRMELYADSNATLSSISRLSVLHLTHQVTNAPQTNRFGWILMTQNGAQASDAMILATNLATLPAVAMTGDRTIGSTAGDYAISVYLQSQPGTQQWYIPLIKGLGA